MQKILITGTAGFIGFHTAKRLLNEDCQVIGIDNFNDYYDPVLKEARHAQLTEYPNYTGIRGSLEEPGLVDEIMKTHNPDAVVNLAAQAGVRYSLENPLSYIRSNLLGFANILEACRHHGTQHLVYASSSSVYGSNTKYPFSIHDNVDHPISLYAATKKSNELMAHTYSHLYGIPTTGLRFFTVYGPWGRPDMAAFLFTKAILDGKPINVFNDGKMQRDFTFVEDIVEGIVRVLRKPAAPNPDWDPAHPDPGSAKVPYRLYNIGNNKPTELLRFIEVLEDALGMKAEKNFLPMQPGDVLATAADISDLQRDTGFEPKTPIEEGLPKFVAWYRQYFLGQ